MSGVNKKSSIASATRVQNPCRHRGFGATARLARLRTVARSDSNFSYTRGFRKISEFPYNFEGKMVLDIGSSTGGFTEYALAQGAEKVIAVEKGTNQMKAPLRFDPRIELHEKTDIFEFTTEEKIDTVVADVSFISLTKVLKYVRMRLARSNTDFLVMVKPQFEAEPRQLNKGVVKNERTRREILKRFEEWLKRNDFIVRMKKDNELRGKNGNLERFYWLKQAKK